MKSELIKYAEGTGCNSTVMEWLGCRIEAKHDQSEVEHIIDYLVSARAPTRLERATYEQMKKGAERWTLSLQKRGLKIKEAPDDVEVVKKWNGGFHMVKLIGKHAYEREGNLMRHCVAGYYGKDDEIYSLRDKDNMPHATLSRSSQQIKGKGNGSIHPKYVKYVVEFLEHLNIDVRDSEMANLGYVNIEKIDDKKAVFQKKYLFRDTYFFKESVDQIVDKDGNHYENMTLWDMFGLFEFTSSMKVKFNFSVKNCVEYFKVMLKNTKGKKVQAGGNSAIQAGGDYATQAGGNSAIQAGGNSTMQAGGDFAKQAGGNSSKQAGGHCAIQAGGNSTIQAGGNSSKQAGGDFAMQAGGDYAMQAGGYSAMQAGGDFAKQAGGNSSKQVGGDSSMQAGGNSAIQAGGNSTMQAGGDFAKQAGGNSSKQAGGYCAIQAGGNSTIQAGGNSSKQAGGDFAMQAGGDYATQEAGANSIMAASWNSSQTMKGVNSLALSGKGSKVRGVRGSWIILTEWDNDNNIVAIHPRKVDDIDVEAMVFYTLKDGNFVKAENNT